MNANEIATRMGEHVSHLAALLGQFEAEISERQARLTELPEVTAELSRTRQDLAHRRDELQDILAKLQKAQVDRDRLVKLLGGG